MAEEEEEREPRGVFNPHVVDLISLDAETRGLLKLGEITQHFLTKPDGNPYKAFLELHTAALANID